MEITSSEKLHIAANHLQKAASILRLEGYDGAADHVEFCALDAINTANDIMRYEQQEIRPVVVEFKRSPPGIWKGRQ